MSLTLKASPRPPIPFFIIVVFNRGSASIPSSPFHICTTPPLLQSRPLAALSNSSFTYRYRTSHSPRSITPMHDPIQVREHQHPSSTPTPTPARRTDAALSVSVRSWGAVQGRGGAGGGGGHECRFGGKRMRERVATQRVRVRTDEDRSSVRAWRSASRFSAWTAEAVEEDGGVLLPLDVAVGVIKRDHDVTSRSNS